MDFPYIYEMLVLALEWAWSLRHGVAFLQSRMYMQNKLRYFRFMCGELTQQELAEKAGVTRQTIIAIEKGTFNPSVKLALKLASILGTTVEAMFMLEEKD